MRGDASPIAILFRILRNESNVNGIHSPKPTVSRPTRRGRMGVAVDSDRARACCAPTARLNRHIPNATASCHRCSLLDAPPSCKARPNRAVAAAAGGAAPQRFATVRARVAVRDVTIVGGSVTVADAQNQVPRAQDGVR